MNVTSHAVKGSIVAAILVVALSGNAGLTQTESAAAPASAHSPGKRVTLLGVGNFGLVSPTLYRGGQPSPQGLEGLAKMGVNIVVDVRLSGRDKERQEVTKQGMQFVELPWHCLFPKDDPFVRFLALLRDNPGKRYLYIAATAMIAPE